MRPDKEGRTPLIMAIYGGHTSVVRCLLDHGADIGRKDDRGRTALLYAQQAGRRDLDNILRDTIRARAIAEREEKLRKEAEVREYFANIIKRAQQKRQQQIGEEDIGRPTRRQGRARRRARTAPSRRRPRHR